MIGTVLLSEYQDTPVQLSTEDAAFVAAQLLGRISIRRGVTGEAYILNSHQFVGLVTLPSGRQLECQPKVPVHNLFYMMAVAFDLPNPFLDAPASVERIDDVLAVIAGRFASLVEERVNRGLYRAYMEDEGNLAMVRGRIAVAEDVWHNYVLRHRTYCRYTEYSWDVPENRVVRQVVRLLAGRRFNSALRHRLPALDSALEEVTHGRYVAADLDRFVYNRLNDDYRPLHRLCRFFLQGASPSQEAEPFPFDAFLLDMNRLFEAFVTRVLKGQAPVPLTVHAQSSTSLDAAGEVRLRPDVVIRRPGSVALVADCKYKRIMAGEHRHHDLYQLLAYCTSLNVSQGLLIYPEHLAPVNTEVAVLNTDVSIKEVSIELGGDLDALTSACDELAGLIFENAQS